MKVLWITMTLRMTGATKICSAWRRRCLVPNYEWWSHLLNKTTMHGIKRQLLQKIAIFGALSDDILEFLLQRTSEIGCAPGEFIFHEGEPADAIYIIESGRVATLKAWEGQQYLLGYLGSGDCFGEMALMDMNPRSASVQAVEASFIIKLESTALLELYQQDLEQFALFQMNLGREVSRRLRESDERMFLWRVSPEARSELPKYYDSTADMSWLEAD